RSSGISATARERWSGFFLILFRNWEVDCLGRLVEGSGDTLIEARARNRPVIVFQDGVVCTDAGGLTVGGRGLQSLVSFRSPRVAGLDSFMSSSLTPQEAIRKARVLVEALGWIRRFRGRPTVIKLGGSALEETNAVRALRSGVI